MTPSSTRPRYARIGLLAGAVLVTLVTVLGGLGVLPRGEPASAQDGGAAELSLAAEAPKRAVGARRSAAGEEAPGSVPLDGTDRSFSGSVAPASERLPDGSGQGRRVVFDMSAQRVWLVAGGGRVRRTYLVSGSLTDNLAPGSYSVYSRSERAWGVDDSGSMELMVRFARGERAAIGFHTIPVKDGVPLQSEDQLGTPQSHGCIRQARPDAKALWDFAQLGTPVVVTA